MKTYITTIIKAIVFFLLWAAGLSGILNLLERLPFMNDSLVSSIFVTELTALLVLVILTVIFLFFVEKKSFRIPFSAHITKDLLCGGVSGFAWIALALLVPFLMGAWKIDGYNNNIAYLPLFITALLLNTFMQEYLVRGYLYQLIRTKISPLAGVLFTTALFTVLHGGAMEAGWLAILNVITMSLFSSMLLLYSGGMLAPIIAHFIWNLGGGMLTDSIDIGGYPNIFNVTLKGHNLISGGIYGIENNLITLILNTLLCMLFAYLYWKKTSRKRTPS